METWARSVARSSRTGRTSAGAATAATLRTAPRALSTKTRTSGRSTGVGPSRISATGSARPRDRAKRWAERTLSRVIAGCRGSRPLGTLPWPDVVIAHDLPEFPLAAGESVEHGVHRHAAQQPDGVPAERVRLRR